MLECLRSSDKEPLNFADKYTLLEIGCGTGCVKFCLIDRVTGDVFLGKDFNQDFPNNYNGETGLKYKRGSKLLTIYHATAFNYPVHVDQYVWENQSLVLLHREKIAK